MLGLQRGVEKLFVFDFDLIIEPCKKVRVGFFLELIYIKRGHCFWRGVAWRGQKKSVNPLTLKLVASFI